MKAPAFGEASPLWGGEKVKAEKRGGKPSTGGYLHRGNEGDKGKKPKEAGRRAREYFPAEVRRRSEERKYNRIKLVNSGSEL
jgi:hypothetical protein